MLSGPFFICLESTMLSAIRTDIMLALGWKRSAIRLSWISPSGAEFPDHVLAALPPDVLREVLISAKTLDPPKSDTWSPYEKLAMRLGVPKGRTIGADCFHIHVGKQLTHILLVRNDQSTVLTDDNNLYPSDTLLAKVRLFLEATK
jgi:hypothetical protein